MKLVCSKMKWGYDKAAGESRRVCHCEDSCRVKTDCFSPCYFLDRSVIISVKGGYST